MYHLLVAQCVANLEAVEGWLEKAEAFASENGIAMTTLLEGRLAPDMNGFIYQVQSACDYVKGGAAWLAGQTPPAHPDNEQTLDEVKARIRKTVAFARAIDPSAYDNAAGRYIRMSWKPGMVLRAPDYVSQMTIPNVYFHLSMAYAILRHQGVPLGKMDIWDRMRFVPDPEE